MAERQVNPASLIDQSLIKNSSDRWEFLKQKLSEAKATLIAAESALAQADRQFKAAVAGTAEGADHDISPAQANAAYQTAVGDRELARRAVDHLETAVTEAFEQHKAASRDAHTPVLLEGINIRIAAAAMADQARKLMAEAEAESRRGTGFCRIAFAAGLRPFDGGMLDVPVRTESDERAIWNGVVR